MAPALGFEPRTKWLTATYSTAELCRSVVTLLNIYPDIVFVNTQMIKKMTFYENSTRKRGGGGGEDNLFFKKHGRSRKKAHILQASGNLCAGGKYRDETLSPVALWDRQFIIPGGLFDVQLKNQSIRCP